MTWIQQLQGQSGNFTPILQTLTPNDGVAFELIVQLLTEHAAATGHTLEEYVTEGIGVDFSEYFIDDEIAITSANISTIRAVGLISCPDNIHVGLTTLGAGFLASVNSQ